MHCWSTYDANLLYSFKNINYTQPVVDIQFHPFENMLAMCSIGTLHQVYVFQHTFHDADLEARPLPRQYPAKPGVQSGMTPGASVLLSDDEQSRPFGRNEQSDRSARPTTVSDTDRSVPKARTESSADELSSRAPSRSDARNRRLAVVNKILDEMDDVIVSIDLGSLCLEQPILLMR